MGCLLMSEKVYGPYALFNAALKLKKKLAVAKDDLIQIKKILREIIHNESPGPLRDMARRRLEALTHETNK